MPDSPAKAERYKVVGGSQSGHCCFDATVVDTTSPVRIGGQHYEGLYEAVCECFERAYAEQIAAALNATNGGGIGERAAPALAEQFDAPGPRNPLIPIAADARAGQEPCGECHIKPGEKCDVCGASRPA